MSDIVLRPELHFTPRRHWMNDPNGCVYHHGLYHLFFQYHPYSSVWGPMHWGHATSTDLLHWQEQPVALSPDEHGMVFSGTVVQDPENTSGLFSSADGLAAFYTSHLEAPHRPYPLQQQCLASSEDNGWSWKTFPGNPILTNPGFKDFRDPKVLFHHETQNWIMLVVAGRSVRFYRSANLTDWSFCSEFQKAQGNSEVVWECPDLMQLIDDSGTSHWVLFVSGVTTPEAPFPPMQYFVGQFDGHTFTESDSSTDIKRVDYGLDFYAAQSFNGLQFPEQQPIWIAWANHWFYANVIPAQGWRGIMTLPRRLSLAETPHGLRLRQQPPEGIEQELPRQIVISDGQRQTLPLSTTIQVLRVNLSRNTPSMDISLSNHLEERITFRWDAKTNLFSFERHELPQSSRHPAMQTVQQVNLTEYTNHQNTVPVTILIDGAIAEIFLVDGLAVITSLIFPRAPLQDLLILTDDISAGSTHVTYHYG